MQYLIYTLNLIMIDLAIHILFITGYRIPLTCLIAMHIPIYCGKLSSFDNDMIITFISNAKVRLCIKF